MRLIPSVDIELLTSFSKEEVESILMNNIGSKRGILQMDNLRYKGPSTIKIHFFHKLKEP